MYTKKEEDIIYHINNDTYIYIYIILLKSMNYNKRLTHTNTIPNIYTIKISINYNLVMLSYFTSSGKILKKIYLCITKISRLILNNKIISKKLLVIYIYIYTSIYIYIYIYATYYLQMYIM